MTNQNVQTPPPERAADLLSELELAHDPTRLKDRALAAAHEGITISDARLPDNPLMYANQGFERLTGYAASDVVGRNCRFLQGPETEPEVVAELRRAVAERRPSTVELLNYRKDGTPFWNRLAITPVRDADGVTTHFIGIQSDVTERRRATEALEEARRELDEANRRMTRDLQAAARIQRSLLPDRPPPMAGLRTAWAFRPCDELAGDGLNLFPLDDRRTGFYLLDVSGHGVPAALLSVSLTRQLSPRPGGVVLEPADGTEGAPAVRPPAGVIAALDRQLELDPDAPQYATVFYGVVDRATGRVEYASAGHPPAIHLPRDGEPRLLGAGGPPVGLLPGAEVRPGSLALAPGDRLVVYSDGLSESSSPRGVELGRERLVQALDGLRRRPLDEIPAAVLAAVERYRGGRAAEDDISLLVLERPAEGPPEGADGG